MSKKLYEWLAVEYKVSLISFIVLVISLILYFLSPTYITGNYLEAFKLIAIGMVPACLIGLLWEAFIKKEFVQYILREVKLSDQIIKFGVKGIFPKRDERDIISSFENAKTRIWILLTWLSYLTETGIQKSLIDKAKNKNIDIRILGLNSESICAEIRGKQHDKHKGLKKEIPNYLEKFIDPLIKEIGTNAVNVKVGLYDAESPIACFIIDDDLYFSPLLLNKNRGRDSVHFLVSNSIDNKSLLFSEVEEHFDHLFKEHAIWIYPPKQKKNCRVKKLDKIRL